MSGKILARAVAITLALFLAACGGDDSSTPLAPIGSENTSPDGGGDDGVGDSGGGETATSLELGTGSGSNFQSGQIQVSAPNLTSGGVTRLDFNVVDAANGNTLFNAEETTVTLSSLCEAAVFDRTIITTSGSVSTTYEAGCPGIDTITSRLASGASATANVTVAAQEVGELEFISVDPNSISLSGSSDGTRGSVSEVTFRLADKNGSPISGEELSFSLSTTVGGITLSQVSAETDQEGQAKTRVNSGSVATVVSVTATATLPDGDIIQTASDPISISSSIPDQDSFSLAISENFLPNARNYDGERVSVPVRAADRNNNRVSGAVVNFITNGGSVQSECILEDGACTIDWISQDPRPEDGVVLILARTVGEESFRDLNSDGKFTLGTDSFDVTTDDRGEAFLDRNLNRTRDSDEEYFDYNSNNQYDGANGIYNGTACADENCTQDLLEISQTGKIFMASDSLLLTFISPEDPSPASPILPGSVCVEVAGVFTDSRGVLVQGPPPGGTEISFSTTNGTLIAPSTFTSTTKFTTEPVEFCVTVESDSTPSTGTFTIEATPPAPFTGDPFIQQAPISD
ncbi:hypothetical protein [Marinobacter sp.]|uniref:hypothetical protein n=1 Tax=Marinobacter sp. TaxID=50741 RepID=UPI00384AF129